MGELFIISDEFKKKLYPKALEVFNNWSVDILNQTKVEEFSPDDREFLSAADIIKLKRIYEVSECLNKCVDIKDGDKLYDVYFGDIFLSKGVISQLKRDLLNIEFDIVPPLKKIYEGRVAKAKEEERKRVEEAREEQRKREEEERRQTEKAKEEQKIREEAAEAERRQKEEEERWCDARGAVNPPINDAKRYLDRLGEYDEFIQATLEAIEVYIKKGEDYPHNSGTLDYRHWLWKINYRKEEERINNDAQAQAQAFRARLDQGLKEIEKMLSPKKEDPTVIFKRWCSNKGEKRYLDEPFTDILASENKKNRKWTQGYIPGAETKLQESVPGELRDFILTEPTAAFFLLPIANYSNYGVPCLDFYFDVFAVVTITVSAKAGQKVFNGYKFSYLTNLREPEPLGFYQMIITPHESHFWQSLPISIFRALIDGNLQPPGTTILKRKDQLTVYEVKKFKEDICAIPISFEQYCRSLGSYEKMRELGIIKERTAEILELSRPISINHKESKSKKAQAFELFNEGKRPSDSEVKSLGIKPESAYRYYQQWKKASYSR